MKRPWYVTALTAVSILVAAVVAPSAAAATPPSVPLSVSAAQATTATTSATLKWAAPSSAGDSAVSGYVVARDGKDSTGYGAWSGTVSASTRSATFNQLIPGTTYTLSVRAKNASGLGPVANVTYAVSPSGVPMPVGNLSGWKQVFTEDFTTPVALGSWPSSYSSKFGDYTYTGCTYSTADKRWYGCDTSRNGSWNAKKTVSVGGGSADYWLHSENGVAYSAAILPKAAQQTYGRYEVRFKVDSGMTGWKSAWLLWPDSDKWADGEMDWPEGDLTGSMNAFTHYVGDPNSQTQSDSGVAFASGWHTATTEWLPGAMKYYLDGRLIGTHTTRVSGNPMHWVLQSETGDTKPTTSGHIKIDWAVQYARS